MLCRKTDNRSLALRPLLGSCCGSAVLSGTNLSFQGHHRDTASSCKSQKSENISLTKIGVPSSQLPGVTAGVVAPWFLWGRLCLYFCSLHQAHGMWHTFSSSQAGCLPSCVSSSVSGRWKGMVWQIKARTKRASLEASFCDFNSPWQQESWCLCKLKQNQTRVSQRGTSSWTEVAGSAQPSARLN